MSRIFIYTLILFSLAVSCKPGIENTIKKKGIIPEKAFIEILTEYSIAEGIINEPSLGNTLDFNDSLSIHLLILSNKGYTREQLDHTLGYYFLRKPKRLEQIYDEVLKNLSEMEARIDSKISSSTEKTKNLWNGKGAYFLPQDGVAEKIAFNIAIKDTGLYRLTVNITMFTDDQSLDPRVSAYFWYDNGTPEGVSIPWEGTPINKDGMTHEYVLTSNNNDPLITHIRGYLLDHSPQPGSHWEKNVRIDKIILEKVEPEKDPYQETEEKAAEEENR